MTPREKCLIAFCVFLSILVTAFIAEHIMLVRDYQRDQRALQDPNPPCHVVPAPKGRA